MSEITWETFGPGSPVNVEKLEHYDQLKVDDDASEGQKEFARRFNAMRKKLLDHGLMNKK